MRSIILTVAAAFALLLGVLILFPSTVVPTKSVVAAFSGICVARTAVRRIPVFYLTSCDDTIRRVPFEKVGRTIPCADCAKHDLYLPPVTLFQVLKQNVQNFLLSMDRHAIAFPCRPIAARRDRRKSTRLDASADRQTRVTQPVIRVTPVVRDCQARVVLHYGEMFAPQTVPASVEAPPTNVAAEMNRGEEFSPLRTSCVPSI